MVITSPGPGQVTAPVSGNDLGVLRAEIKPGVREIHLCKDERGKTGLRLQAVDKVSNVWSGVPAGDCAPLVLDSPVTAPGIQVPLWDSHPAA